MYVGLYIAETYHESWEHSSVFKTFSIGPFTIMSRTKWKLIISHCIGLLFPSFVFFYCCNLNCFQAGVVSASTKEQSCRYGNVSFLTLGRTEKRSQPTHRIILYLYQLTDFSHHPWSTKSWYVVVAMVMILSAQDL